MRQILAQKLRRDHSRQQTEGLFSRSRILFGFKIGAAKFPAQGILQAINSREKIFHVETRINTDYFYATRESAEKLQGILRSRTLTVERYFCRRQFDSQFLQQRQ